MKVKALTGFDFVSSYQQRQKIRKGIKIAHEDRNVQEVAIGDVMDAPADLVDSWFKRGMVEEV